MSGTPDSRIEAVRNRLNIIKQTVMRNDHFSPSTIAARDRENLLTVNWLKYLLESLTLTFSQLRSTKQLLGRAGQRFLLFGMLTHSKEGKLCLEDEDGFVELDFSQLVGTAPGQRVRNLKLHRTNPARACSQKDALLWWRVIIPKRRISWSLPSAIHHAKTEKRRDPYTATSTFLAKALPLLPKM